MQFNTIYINNISKELDQHIVDATSTTSTFDALTAGSIPSVDESLQSIGCLLYTSPSPRDDQTSRMPSSA